jgi:4-hydroxybenzoate polyprenyltransferase
MATFAQRIRIFLEMIKFEHTVFALPFALTGALLAARGLPTWRQVGWIVAAAVFARTAAMSFNRWADAALDAQNPRTRSRAIPQGLLSKNFALGVTLLCCIGFVASAYALNWLAFSLSPVALLILLGYSYTKRFTSLSHFVLGLALGLAPAGAWIAVKGTLELPAILLTCSVITWVAGFDIIYACQDFDFDKQVGLYSIPARLGIKRALQLSALLHVLTVLFLVCVGMSSGLGSWYYAGVASAAALLWYEHHVVHPEDLSRLEVAFFTANSWVGVAIFGFTALDLFM